MTSAAIVLSVEGLQVGYGDLTAVWEADLAVRPGRVLAVVGRNGAGKTTLLRGIAGLLRPTRGTVTLDGTEISALPPHRRGALGLSLVLEGKRIFRPLTVHENLQMGAFARRVGRRAADELMEEMYERFPALAGRRTARAGDLSGGQQQMLAIAQALMSRPRVLMLDEPSSGLAPAVVDQVFAIVAGLRSDGIGVVLVEQLVAEMLSGVADDVVVLDGGRVVLAAEATSLSVEQLAGLVYTS